MKFIFKILGTKVFWGLLLFPVLTQAQLQLSNFYPKSAAYLDTVFIVGNGFGTDPSSLIVNVGKGQAEVANVSEQLIKVLVPHHATFGIISVTDRLSRTTANFSTPFLPVYESTGFDQTHLGSSQRLISEESGLYDLCTCDFDTDGDLDIGTVNNDDGAALSSVNVFGNVSTDPANVSFVKVPGSYFNINQAARNITCGDLNGDGKPELIVSQGGDVAEKIFVFQNISSTSPATIKFSSPIVLNSDFEGQTNSNRRIKLHDIDGDLRPEIVVTNQIAGVLIIFKNESTGGGISFPEEKRKFISVPSNTLGLDINDIDGDNKADIITSNNLSSNLYVIRNESQAGTLKFADPVTIALTGQLVNLKTGDVDGDNKQDIVLLDFQNEAVIVLPNQSTPGNVSFGSATYLNAVLKPWGIDIADISGDGKLDLAIATISPTDNIVVLENNSTPGNLGFTALPAGTASEYRNLRVADINTDGKPDIVTTEKDASGSFFVSYIPNQACFKSSIYPEVAPAICEAQPVTLYATQVMNAAYQWYQNGTPISGATSPTLSVASSGNYTVAISDAFSACTHTSEAINIVEDSGTIPDPPLITAPTRLCEGEDLSLSVPADPSFEYRWTGPNGFQSSSPNPTIADATPAQAGLYTLEVKQGLCKSNVSRVMVEIVPHRTIEVSVPSGATLCPGESGVLQVEDPELSEFQWYKDDELLSGEDSAMLTVSEEGSYRVSALSSTGCRIGSESLAINVLPLQSDFTVSSSEACVNQEINFSSQGLEPTDGSVVYHWDFGDGTSSSSQHPSHIYSSADSYTVKHTIILNDGSCTSTSIEGLTIHASSEAYITSPAQVLCPGDTLVLEAIGDFTDITWDDESKARQRTVTAGGTFSATVTNALGCDTTLSYTISQKDLPNVVINIPDNIVLNHGDSVQLQAEGADYYLWQPAIGLSDSTKANPFAKPLKTQTYTVTGYTTDGCSQTAEVMIRVHIDQIPVDALNIFSPNGDGIEDSWVIDNIDDFPECYFLVFDAQGREVFRTSTPYLNDWQGTNQQGQPLEAGIYYYVARCGGKANNASGSISIVR